MLHGAATSWQSPCCVVGKGFNRMQRQGTMPICVDASIHVWHVCQRLMRCHRPMHSDCMPAGGTRCCIHTPSAPLLPDDISDGLVAQALDGAALVFFDGRLTEAALLLADAARVSTSGVVGSAIVAALLCRHAAGAVWPPGLVSFPQQQDACRRNAASQCWRKRSGSGTACPTCCSAPASSPAPHTIPG